MNAIARLTLSLVAVVLALTGCSSIHTSLSSDKQISELRASVEAPLELTLGETPFCSKPEITPAEPTPIYTAPEPFSAKLYFLLDKTEFTAESEIESDTIYQEILKRNPTEVIVSGHTDTAASSTYNDALSRRRAERVKQDLIEAGVATDIITLSSEGEYRLLVATPDETVETRNRRVEINLR